MRGRRIALAVGATLVIVAVAQDHPMGPPDVLPPPPLPTQQPEHDRPIRHNERFHPESDAPWGLPPELVTALAERVRLYQGFALGFTCDETARLADYNKEGQPGKEKIRRYAYLLERSRSGIEIVESRQVLGAKGNLKPGAVKDEEPFPPAYAWVFLFSDFNSPYFAFRDLGDRFDGFDWVREIQFKGALAFTDGKDIRQWEGLVLLDASTLTPIEILAQPSGQDEKIVSLYRQWSKSFNVMGFRTGPKPLTYRGRIQFRFRQKGLTFPTELRYDTARAVSAETEVPVKASVRIYENYRFYMTRPGTEVFEDS